MVTDKETNKKTDRHRSFIVIQIYNIFNMFVYAICMYDYLNSCKIDNPLLREY